LKSSRIARNSDAKHVCSYLTVMVYDLNLSFL
jgi:hypothetical protein